LLNRKIEAAAIVVFPRVVKIPCNETNPYNSAALSYMCHVIAHIAPIKLGIIEIPSQKKDLYLL
tara:strand:+ start:102 stop:293 length:192 start_codon:yes stop_codon:yes gene_type:complete